MHCNSACKLVHYREAWWGGYEAVGARRAADARRGKTCSGRAGNGESAGGAPTEYGLSDGATVAVPRPSRSGDGRSSTSGGAARPAVVAGAGGRRGVGQWSICVQILSVRVPRVQVSDKHRLISEISSQFSHCTSQFPKLFNDLLALMIPKRHFRAATRWCGVLDPPTRWP